MSQEYHPAKVLEHSSTEDDYQPEPLTTVRDDPVSRALEYAAKNWKQGVSALEMVQWAMNHANDVTGWEEEQLSFKAKDPARDKSDHLASFSQERAYEQAELQETINIHLAGFRADGMIQAADQALAEGNADRQQYENLRLEALTQLADTITWNNQQLSQNKSIADWTAQEAEIAQKYPLGYQAITNAVFHGVPLEHTFPGMPGQTVSLDENTPNGLIMAAHPQGVNAALEQYADNLYDQLMEAKQNSAPGDIVQIEHFRDTIPRIESQLKHHTNVAHETLEVLAHMQARETLFEGSAQMVHNSVTEQIRWERSYDHNIEYRSASETAIDDAFDLTDRLYLHISDDHSLMEAQTEEIMARLEEPLYLQIFSQYLKEMPRDEAYTILQQAAQQAAADWTQTNHPDSPDEAALTEAQEKRYATAILTGSTPETQR